MSDLAAAEAAEATAGTLEREHRRSSSAGREQDVRQRASLLLLLLGLLTLFMLLTSAGDSGQLAGQWTLYLR